MKLTEPVQMSRLIAFIEAHGNKVVSHTDSTITAQCEEMRGGKWSTVEETFPATLRDARIWLGY